MSPVHIVNTTQKKITVVRIQVPERTEGIEKRINLTEENKPVVSYNHPEEEEIIIQTIDLRIIGNPIERITLPKGAEEMAGEAMENQSQKVQKVMEIVVVIASKDVPKI